MSTNHYSTDLPEAQNWWTKNQNIMDPSRNQNTNNTTFYTQNTSFTFNLNHEDEELEVDDQQQFSTTNETMEKDFDEHQESNQEIIIPKESLFEKPLTPSDVGKLNRLVIPKQHAEKYFPLSSNTNDSVEKGLLLGFEDESGKPWKFRYSYWNSSQSYVLTKGWSRFVKEKRLDAGDIVLFQRHQHDGERFFIGWRRKGSTPVIQPPSQLATVVNGDTSGWTPLFNSGHPYPSHASQLPYHQPDYIHAGSGVTVAAAVQNQTTTRTSGFPKRLRLFGVNLECQPQHYSHFDPSTLDPNPNPNSHMDTNFSRDVNYQMRYRHG